MRIDSTSRLGADLRIEKEAKLKDFIAEGALALAAEVPPSATAPITLIARNPDSPAAQALFAVLSRDGAAATGVRVIFFETLLDETSPASLFDMPAVELRVLCDARFGSAHEQLVIGSSRVWIGDCMRRDPAKRDAFELYHACDLINAGHAAQSFSRLWSAAKPVKQARTLAPQYLLAGQAASLDPAPVTRR